MRQLMIVQVTIPPATPWNAAGMARIHVTSWQETSLGVMSDESLDDPLFGSTRERFWMIVRTDERFAPHRIAVSENGRELAGIAQSAS